MKYRIWDPVVRLFHWSVALCFLLNYWLLEPGEPWHEYLGYAVAAALTCRIIWGFCGSQHARFAAFFPTPARLRHFFQHPEARYPIDGGHNALAAVMVLFMLMLLVLVTVSGWLQETDRFWGEDWVQLMHAWSANTLMVTVIVHVVSVIVIQKKSGVTLISPMINGYRR